MLWVESRFEEALFRRRSKGSERLSARPSPFLDAYDELEQPFAILAAALRSEWFNPGAVLVPQ